MPDLLDRRKRGLEEQFAALPAELESWKGLSQRGGVFEKHQSQIQALSRQMLALNAKVKAEWENSQTDPFVAVRIARAKCAAVHTIWNYFREKLVLRLDSRFGVYLKAADAYSWASYEPILSAHSSGPQKQRREPPLVAFDNDVSPWALSRQSRYEVNSEDKTVTGVEFRTVLEALPIPVIGIPWHSTGFLPDMAGLAHETGHVIDIDFGMRARIAPAVGETLLNSPLEMGWSTHWWKEIFADLFACWAAGPSFVWMLADALPESPSTVAIKKRPSGSEWGFYPPPTLRIRLNVAAMRWLGFDQEAEKIWVYWTSDYRDDAMDEYKEDVKVVVKAVYQSGVLPDALKYGNLLDQEARVRKSVFARDGGLPAGEFDPRALVGAASRANREVADKVLLSRGFALLADHIARSRPPGTLARLAASSAAHDPEALETQTQKIYDLLLAGVGDEAA